MYFYHLSEEPNITQFAPRVPDREDMDKSKPLVWAIDEISLPNYLVPRDCPRVTYRTNENTSQEDIARFFSGQSRHCVAIEHDWFGRMANTTLYLYAFDPTGFYLQDGCAGYYVSEQTQTPVAVTKIDDLFQELFKRDVELRMLSNLWELSDAVIQSTLRYSNCRMRNAKPRA